MNPNDLLNQIQSQLDKTLSGAGSITDEVNQLVRVSVTKALSGLDIVSREEFDAQQAVLKRSREKIDLLEKQLSQIEELIKRKSKLWLKLQYNFCKARLILNDYR